MATIQHTRTQTGTTKAVVAVWAPLAAGDAGEAIPFAQYTDRSVQISGTFGGASVVIEGSNDGTNWATLTDPQGNDLTFSGARLEAVSEATAQVRPRVSGGDGSTALSVHMLIKE